MATSRAERRAYRFTMPDEIDAVLCELSEATGMAKTTWIISLLQQAIPTLKAISKAAKNPSHVDVLEEFQDLILHAQADAAQVSLDLNTGIKLRRSGQGRKRAKSTK